MSESISEYSVTALYFIIQKFLLFSDAMCYTSLAEWIAVIWSKFAVGSMTIGRNTFASFTMLYCYTRLKFEKANK